MAAIAKWRNYSNGSITTGGSANAQTVTTPVVFTSVPTNLLLTVKIGFTNTTTATLNVDGIGAVTIKYANGNPLVAGALTAGYYAQFLYDGTNWILLSSGGGPLASLPTKQVFTGSGTSGTYTLPANVRWIRVRAVGSGGGGGAGVAGSDGANTTFGGSIIAGGGKGGAAGGLGLPGGGVGGTAAGGSINIPGGGGQSGTAADNSASAGVGGAGGNSAFGGGGRATYGAGQAGATNSGGGGAGGASVGGTEAAGGGGGGAGGYVEDIITSPATTYAYAIGAVGAGKAALGNVFASAAGGAGIIIVEEFYS
jgi:hypothetical protein